MKALRYYIILLFFVVFVSCKKKTYPESKIEGDKVFYFNATVDNVPVSISAGFKDYYMYSSYKQDANNVYSFIADLKQIDCGVNCANNIRISISDSIVSVPNAPIKISQALHTGSYPILSGSSYDVQFQSGYNKTAVSYFWDFGDGSTSIQANPIHKYNRNGKYNVSLTIKGTNSCIGNINYIQKIDTPVCRTTISAMTTSVSNGMQFFSKTQGGLPPFNYLWDFGDGSTPIAVTSSSPANVSHNYPITGAYPVTLRVIDAANDTAFAKYNAVTQTDISSCATNYTVNSISETAPIPLSKITITWTDASGVVYTSNNALQPSSSYFKIISVEDYEVNEKNETTKKLHVKFKCRVYNGTNYKTIDDAEATICVSYK